MPALKDSWKPENARWVTRRMNLRLLVFTAALLIPPSSAIQARDYEFDGTITRTTLENYLSRSITMLDLLTGHGNVDDNVRMLKSVGAKFTGRTIYLWGHERQLPTGLAAARQNAPKIHAADPQMILQACVFEIVSKDVDKLPIPAWALDAFGQPPEQRNFRYEAMLHPGGRGHNHWRQGSSIPDISQQETRLWNWVREHDPNGFLQMPGSRVLHAPVGNQYWYYANTRSAAAPRGFGPEETIKAIWSGSRNNKLAPQP